MFFCRYEKTRAATARICGCERVSAILGHQMRPQTIPVFRCINRRTGSTHCFSRGIGVVSRFHISRLTTGQFVDAEHSAASNTERSGEMPGVFRTKQPRDCGRTLKSRRSSAGSKSDRVGGRRSVTRRRSVHLTTSIRTLRGDMFSQAPIPSSTAASAVVVSHPRSKAARTHYSQHL